MQKLYLGFSFTFLLLCCSLFETVAQSLSTGFPLLEDYYRREQLLGNINTNFSFVSYPLFPVEAFNRENPFNPDKPFAKSELKRFDGSFELAGGKSIFKLLPIIWKQQYNSHHPESMNDGAMIPSRGYQTLISAGFYFQNEHLSIKIQPEFVHATNLSYEGFPLEYQNPELAGRRWFEYYNNYLNYIDAPERFGESAYNKFYWGQSSIRLNFNTLSVGFSTENIWWGPGRRNSLLMTNSAPGFAHFTINSIKPVQTPIGSFEGQLIAGFLKSSGYPPPQHETIFDGKDPFYIPKREDGRYLNAMIISYQPKWIPGLFLGLIRSFQIHHKDMDDGVLDYLPVFTAFGKKALGGDNEVFNKRRDGYNSVFFRYVWPESQVEFYGEYGRSDYFWNNRDFILQLEHSNAYNLGFRKLIPFNNQKKDNLEISLEITQLAKNPTTILRNGRSWGSSDVVRDGYTNRGQFLGAGIGPGSNMQTVNISWHRSLKTIGLQFERYVHNNDFFFEYITDIRAHWVDISPSFIANWDIKKLLFNIEIKAIDSKNYQWKYEPSTLVYWTPGKDTYNFHGQLSVIYRF